ncbi:hypothetical protein LRP88_09683 [Fusarium phalaenopsidis]
MALPNEPPKDYQTPGFPSLNIQTLYDTTSDKRYTLYYVLDVWRFTLLWTIIIYACFHLAAVLIAMFNHGWKKSSWKYLWAVPIIYLVIAGLEAVLAGSIVGLAGRCLLCRILRNEYLDPMHLGIHQRPGPYHFILLDTRRTLAGNVDYLISFLGLDTSSHVLRTCWAQSWADAAS